MLSCRAGSSVRDRLGWAQGCFFYCLGARWCLYGTWVGSKRMDALQCGNPFRNSVGANLNELGICLYPPCVWVVWVWLCSALECQIAEWPHETFHDISSLCWESWTTLAGQPKRSFGKGWEISIPSGLTVNLSGQAIMRWGQGRWLALEKLPKPIKSCLWLNVKRF